VTRESRGTLEALFLEAAPEASIEELLAKTDLHDWAKEAVREAYRAERDFGTRTVRVPHVETREAYHDLEEFISTVQNSGKRARLEAAVSGRGAFRRFKDVVHNDTDLRDDWHAFKRQRLQQHMTDWLTSMNIDPEWVLPEEDSA
jgi:hypothetical protein